MNLLSFIFGVAAYIFRINDFFEEPIKDLFEIANYNYPKRLEKDGTINIPIICTTDIHGYAFSRQILPEKKFNYGGIQIFHSYIKSLRQDFQGKLLWFDGGDKFQGGVDGTFDNGAIFKKFFNYSDVDLNVLGNHEFDFDMKFISDLFNQLKSTHATTNIYNNITQDEKAFPNTTNYVKHKIFDMGNNIKIGVIGYTPYFSYVVSKKPFQHLLFKELKETINKEAKVLKEQHNVSCVVLLIHHGVACIGDPTNLKMYDNSDYPSHERCGFGDSSKELQEYLLKENDNHLIDAVVGGHLHFLGHHFFKSVPVIHSENNFKHFNILYLPFKNGKIVTEKIKVEGPVPICDKINKKTLKCEFSDAKNEMFEFKFHGHKIKEEKEVFDNILKPYYEQFKKYQRYICLNTVEEPIIRDDWKETLLGNIENDILRNYTNADFSLLNNGVFRATWNKGPLLLEDIYNMNSYDSDIYTIELNGSDFKKIIKGVEYDSLKTIHDISGFRVYINTTFDNISHLTFYNNSDIPDNGTYTFGINDFLLNYFKRTFKWFNPKNTTKFKDEFKVVIDHYLTNLKVIKKSDFYEEDPEKRRFVYIK